MLYTVSWRLTAARHWEMRPALMSIRAINSCRASPHCYVSYTRTLIVLYEGLTYLATDEWTLRVIITAEQKPQLWTNKIVEVVIIIGLPKLDLAGTIGNTRKSIAMQHQGWREQNFDQLRTWGQCLFQCIIASNWFFVLLYVWNDLLS